jgi:hypothetical protein
MNLADHTDDDDDEGVISGQIEPGHSLVLSTAPGEYVIFPDGVSKFASSHKGEAVFLDDGQHVYVLRAGLQKDKMKWVQLTEDNPEG